MLAVLRCWYNRTARQAGSRHRLRIRADGRSLAGKRETLVLAVLLPASKQGKGNGDMFNVLSEKEAYTLRKMMLRAVHHSAKLAFFVSSNRELWEVVNGTLTELAAIHQDLCGHTVMVVCPVCKGSGKVIRKD